MASLLLVFVSRYPVLLHVLLTYRCCVYGTADIIYLRYKRTSAGERQKSGRTLGKGTAVLRVGGTLGG